MGDFNQQTFRVFQLICLFFLFCSMHIFKAAWVILHILVS